MSDSDTEPVEPKSRSQLKREAHAIAAIGVQLAELPKKALARLPLSEEIHEAVAEVRAIKSHGARRRQLGYLGKLLRGVELEPLEAALDRVLDRNKAGTIEARRHEIWRERILRDGESGIEAFIGEHPQAERQRLRQLYRSAARENAADKTRLALLRYLREMDESPVGAGDEE